MRWLSVYVSPISAHTMSSERLTAMSEAYADALRRIYDQLFNY